MSQFILCKSIHSLTNYKCVRLDDCKENLKQPRRTTIRIKVVDFLPSRRKMKIIIHSYLSAA